MAGAHRRSAAPRSLQGTYKGGAQGFTLDSLLKLAVTKSSEANLTLLEFAMDVMENEDRADALEFPKDLSRLQAVSKLQPAEMKKEVTQLEVSNWGGWWVFLTTSARQASTRSGGRWMRPGRTSMERVP